MVKDYFKNVAKSLLGIAPNFTVGLNYAMDRAFIWNTSGYDAYDNKIFYTGANIIVRKMIEAPITFNRKKKSAKKSLDKFYSKSIANPERNTIKDDILEQLYDHELEGLIDTETMQDFWHRYNFGAGLLWFETLNGEYSRNNKPVKVWSLDPRRVNPVTNNGRFDNISHYDYTALNGETIRLEKTHIVYLKHWNPNLEALKGYGVDIVCAKDIALNNAGNEAEGSAFVNGGRGTLFSSKAEVTSEGAVVTKMTAQQMSSLKETMLKDMEGARNNRRMKYTNGEVVVTPYGDTLAEMEINKSEGSRWKNIFAIMGIPKELSPETFSSSENSVDAAYKALVTNLVVSELRKFDKLLTKTIQNFWTDIIAVSDLTEFSELAPDLKLMKEIYGTPSISEDERRRVFGYDEIGGAMGKAILVPMGLQRLEDVILDPFDETQDSDVL